jgi:hypothetical protein
MQESAGNEPFPEGVIRSRFCVSHSVLCFSIPQLKLEVSDDGPLRQIGFLVEEFGILPSGPTSGGGGSGTDDDGGGADAAYSLRINYDGFTQVVHKHSRVVAFIF